MTKISKYNNLDLNGSLRQELHFLWTYSPSVPVLILLNNLISLKYEHVIVSKKSKIRSTERIMIWRYSLQILIWIQFYVFKTSFLN